MHQEATIHEGRQFIIRQGFVTPPIAKIEFLYGTFSPTWAKLIFIVDITEHLERSKSVDMSFIGNSIASFRRMLNVRYFRCQSRELDLLRLLWTFRNTSCYNPRDKVYVPLCLASHSARGFITPNYRKMVMEVYLDVARFYLTQHGDELDFFGFVIKFSFPEGWLSWLPDWRHRMQSEPFGRALYISESPKRAVSTLHV